MAGGLPLIVVGLIMAPLTVLSDNAYGPGSAFITMLVIGVHASLLAVMPTDFVLVRALAAFGVVGLACAAPAAIGTTLYYLSSSEQHSSRRAYNAGLAVYSGLAALVALVALAPTLRRAHWPVT